MPIQANMDYDYLNVPLGSPHYVAKYLDEKLTELKVMLDLVGGMTEYPHEGFRLLQVSLSECRVTHLMHTVLPDELETFIAQFDAAMKKAFERLLKHKVDPSLWRMATGRACNGGLGLPTGKHLCAVYFLMSLAHNEEALAQTAPFVDVLEWVDRYCARLIRLTFPPDLAAAMLAATATGGFFQDPKLTSDYRRSVKQAARLSLDGLFYRALPRKLHEHVKLHRFSGTHWVTVPPIAYMGWCFGEDTWWAAMRLRLGICLLYTSPSPRDS